jgi:hypothetical protein
MEFIGRKGLAASPTGGAHQDQAQIYKIKTLKSIGAHQIHAELIKEAPIQPEWYR